jgi:hypothetical protein
MVNANPINGVPFGRERTKAEYLARATWEYDQASRLRDARKPVGYLALVEGHERAAKAYERAAEGKSSKTAEAHARVRKTKDIWVVQGNYGYGHGWEDVNAEETWTDAKRSIREYRENEPGVSFRVRKKREKIGEVTAPAHARKKKLDPREAKQRLRASGIDFSRDFHELRSSDVEKILDVAKEAGYRKSKNAPGSTARMYFQYLDRLK